MSVLDLEETKIVAIGCPDDFGNRGDVFHLAGPNAGAEGVVWGEEPDGHMFAPTKILSSSSARQDGATPLRSVRDPRELSMTILIGGDTVHEFYANHDRWWRNWSTDRDSFLCFYTKYSGWWHCPVRVSAAADPETGTDPQFNYFERYRMFVTGFDPSYRAPEESFVWRNTLGLSQGSLLIPNRGAWKLWPRYTMPGPGRYYIEDPLSTDEEIRMVQTPMLLEGDLLRIDTFERRQTAMVYSDETGPNGRNVWGQLQGRKWLFPIFPSPKHADAEPTEIRVMVEGGNTDSYVIATTTQRHSRPF